MPNSSTESKLILVRHVPTKLNEQNVSRGWMPVGPDPEKLKEMGPGISKTLQSLNVSRIRSSSLPRSQKTAEWLGNDMDVPTESTSRLKTWNTGDEVAGKPEAETKPLRQKFIKYPEEKPRGGEPFQDFMDRVAPEFKKTEKFNRENPDSPEALVIHGHHVLAAEEVFNGEDVKPEELDTLDDKFPPGSVMLLTVGDKGVSLKRIHPKEQEDSSQNEEKEQ